MKLLTQVRDAFDEVLALLFEEEKPRVDALQDRLQPAPLLGKIADEQALLLEQGLELPELLLLLGQSIPREFDLCVLLALALPDRLPLPLQVSELVDCECDLEVLELGEYLGVLGGLRCLALEGSELAVDLGGDVAGALEVRIHGGEFADRAVSTPLVLENPRSLFDERPAILGAGVEDLVEPTLADDRVGLSAKTTVVQQLVHVHETARTLVDQVLALTAPIHTPRNGDLVELEWQGAVGVVEHQIDLGDPDRLTCRGTRENDIFHRLAAQGLGGLLAEDPQHGVRDVGFARTVGADDHRRSGLEDERRLIGERLEALEYE